MSWNFNTLPKSTKLESNSQEEISTQSNTKKQSIIYCMFWDAAGKIKLKINFLPSFSKYCRSIYVFDLTKTIIQQTSKSGKAL